MKDTPTILWPRSLLGIRNFGYYNLRPSTMGSDLAWG